MTFEAWMDQVDMFVMVIAGVSVHDLPDCLFRDWFDDGVTPEAAAKRALRNAGWR